MKQSVNNADKSTSVVFVEKVQVSHWINQNEQPGSWGTEVLHLKFNS